MLSNLDRWMAANPWHPRLTPYFVYVGVLAAASFVPLAGPWHAVATGLYALQVVVVAWLLWRYRRLLPEVTLRFHWLVIPSAVALTAAWVGLGRLTIELFPGTAPDAVTPAGDQYRMPAIGEAYGQAAMWIALSLRLLGMSLVVPVFEELFMRSAMLRGLHRPGQTGTGLLQLLSDMPVIGDLIGERESVRRANQQPPMLTQQLQRTPLGHLTVFGVIASTIVFTAGHNPRDWAGCVVCGVVWCLMLWWTNRGRSRDQAAPTDATPSGSALGLGPIIWSHGLTNALLWGWVVYTKEWYWL